MHYLKRLNVQFIVVTYQTFFGVTNTQYKNENKSIACFSFNIWGFDTNNLYTIQLHIYKELQDNKHIINNKIKQIHEYFFTINCTQFFFFILSHLILLKSMKTLFKPVLCFVAYKTKQKNSQNNGVVARQLMFSIRLKRTEIIIVRMKVTLCTMENKQKKWQSFKGNLNTFWLRKIIAIQKKKLVNKVIKNNKTENKMQKKEETKQKKGVKK